MEELKADLERGRLEAARPLLALELELQEAAAAGRASEEELVRRQSLTIPSPHPSPLQQP